jgi:hypothetical protein
MNRLLLVTIGVLLVFTVSCGVNSSGNINFNASDVKYVKDHRTNLCFAVTASRKAASLETSGFGLTCVPCEAVKHLIK